MAPVNDAALFSFPDLPDEAASVWSEIQVILVEFSNLTGHLVDWAEASKILGPPVAAAFTTGGSGGAMTAFWASLEANWKEFLSFRMLNPPFASLTISSQLALFSTGYKLGADLS